MKTLQLNAIITGISSKVDRSLSLRISTPELTNKERADFMEYQGINCNLTVEPLDEKAEGIEMIDRELETKTKSQRLRAVLFILWKQEGEQGKFEDYYKNKMEGLIEHFKNKLES